VYIGQNTLLARHRDLFRDDKVAIKEFLPDTAKRLLNERNDDQKTDRSSGGKL
jgi:hypothetical protein